MFCFAPTLEQTSSLSPSLSRPVPTSTSCGKEQLFPMGEPRSQRRKSMGFGPLTCGARKGRHLHSLHTPSKTHGGGSGTTGLDTWESRTWKRPLSAWWVCAHSLTNVSASHVSKGE